MKKDRKNKPTKKKEETEYIFMTDIDGTLNLEDKKLNQAFKTIRKSGGKIAVISGRTIGDIKEEFAKRGLVLPNFIAGDNGACLYDTKKKEFIFRKSLQKEKIKKIMEYYKKIGGNPDLIRYTDGYKIHASNQKEVKEYYKGKKTVDCCTNLQNKVAKENDITKITLAGSQTQMQQMAEFIKELGYWTDTGATKFPNKNNYQRLDIAPDYSNKGQAVKTINKVLRPEYGYACYGNDWNDASMFKQAIKDNMRIFIMGNAPQELIKEVKDYAMKMKKGKVHIISDNLDKANKAIGRMARILQQKQANNEFKNFVRKKGEERFRDGLRVEVKDFKGQNNNNNTSIPRRPYLKESEEK